MRHRFSLIVFDYDGTVVDSQHMIVRAMSEGFAAAGLAPPDPQKVLRGVGLSLEQACAILLPDPGDTAMTARVAAGYRKAALALRTGPEHYEPLYPGAREVLMQLDQGEVVLGIATGKSQRGLLASLENHGLRRHFLTLQTADMAAGKPDPEMLHRAMSDAGTAPHETVLIGDTSYDMEMAGNAGVTAIGVAWGYHESDELRQAGAAAIAETFKTLPAALAALPVM